MHYHYIEGATGDLIDLVPFCSDDCHRSWCADTGEEYIWNGCHEGADYPEYCAQCGVYAGGTPECDCQRYNVLVNRLRCDAPEICAHGNVIQLVVKRGNDDGN
jgi:hypothetical protein